jgi:pyridoxine 4-dehydrogenase
MTEGAAASGTSTIGGDMPVNRLGFGAMRITGRGIWGRPNDEEQCRAVLRRALELGVTFIDTADSYGPEVSENLIADTLFPYPSGLVIATKGGLLRNGPGRWRADCSGGHLREAIDGSLRRLKIDRIDVYQLHTVDRKVPLEESVGALADLQREGKIHHVGLSNVTVDQLARARKQVDIVSVQNRYNVTDRRSDRVVDECERLGIGFIPWAPVDAGALRRPGRTVETVAREHGATLAQVFIAWLLHRSKVMLPIPGTSSLEHLVENVAAAGLKLNEDEVRRIDEAGR